MQTININFFDNFQKNRIDENNYSLVEEKLEFKLAEKHKKYLIKNYRRKIRFNERLSSKYINEEIIKRIGIGRELIRYKKDKIKAIQIDKSNMCLCGIIETEDNIEYDILIAIGIKNSKIEDELYISYDNENISYLCKNIDEFIDSLIDKDGNKVKFTNDTYFSDQLIEEDIFKVEEEIGLKFPESYKKFLLETNGGEINTPNIIDVTNGKEIECLKYLYNKYSPKEEMNSDDYPRLNFKLAEILHYWNVLDGTWEGSECNFKAISEKKIIPIGLNGDTGVFFVGAKDYENEGKIFFYDYVLSDNGKDYNPEAIELLCNSFDEYINNFYVDIPDNIEYTLKSRVEYIFPR